MTQADWKQVRDFEDITYHKSDGVARIAFDRPEVRNAFRPETLFELQEAFKDAADDLEIGVILLTGNGPAKDGKYSFCAGGDQRVRGHGGYVGGDGVPRLNVLGPAAFHSDHAEAGDRAGCGICDRRRSCAPCGL